MLLVYLYQHLVVQLVLLQHPQHLTLRRNVDIVLFSWYPIEYRLRLLLES